MNMAGKATSVYVTVVDANHKTVEHKKFFQMKEAYQFKIDNLAKYPKPQYQWITETY